MRSSSTKESRLSVADKKVFNGSTTEMYFLERKINIS